MRKHINAGKYKHKIIIYTVDQGKDNEGFPIETKFIVLKPYADIKTTKGFTLIANNSDFEKAFTNFTIRYSLLVEDAYYRSENSNRDMLIEYKNKIYKVEYLNNIDEENIEIEMQCKRVMK